MAGYTKLFNSILASTIWRADDKTRLVWITLLAMADRHGVAEGSIPGLADFARVSIPDCEAALARLSAPDSYSRSQVQDGRRIEAVDGGWRLVNHAKYRQKLGADERREYLRVKQAEFRKRRKSTHVNNVSDKSTLLTHTEAEAAPEAVPVQKHKKSGGKRPIFEGQRFVIFQWMHDELARVLGAYTEAFDLHAWFFDLDAKAVTDGLIMAKEGWWPWVQTELLAEATHRGLPVTSRVSAAPARTPSETKVEAYCAQKAQERAAERKAREGER